jgi:hypothetical protein
MITFRDQLEANLICRCGERNGPDKPHAIRIDNERITRAGCDTCGHDGPIQDFLEVKAKAGA